jgi:hypothetical protein
MDSTISEDSKTAAHKIGHATAETGRAIADGSRTLIQNGARDLSDGAKVVADATRTVVRDGSRDVVVAAQAVGEATRKAADDLAEGAKDAGRETKKAIAPPPGAVTPSTAPDAVVPSA